MRLESQDVSRSFANSLLLISMKNHDFSPQGKMVALPVSIRCFFSEWAYEEKLEWECLLEGAEAKTMLLLQGTGFSQMKI